MAVQERLYTAAELLALPREGKRYELLKGTLIEMAPTGEIHGVLTAELAFLLTAFVRQYDLGRVYGAETGFKLAENPDTVVGADAAFVSKARLKPLKEDYFDGAPDLAVEVMSPGNTKTEMHEKVKAYFEAGARLVWFVFPKARAVYAYTDATTVTILTENDTLTGGDVLPGFAVKVSEIFSVLD
jgi:Uma2 family endonuclease